MITDKIVTDNFGNKEENILADQRQAALENALRKIEKNFGKGSIMRMGDAADTKIATVSSGSLAIDEALGVGGYPRGRISRTCCSLSQIPVKKAWKLLMP